MMNFFGSMPAPPKPPLRPPAPPLARRTVARRSPEARRHIAPIAAPAPAPEPGIIGSWHDPDDTETVEFHADGTVAAQTAGHEKLHGRYALRGSELTVQLEGLEEMSFTMLLNATTLELRDSEGQVTRYLR